MSRRYPRPLPDGYKQQLASMSDEQIAERAACFRSDSRRCKGSSTAAILTWYRNRFGQAAYEAFLIIYAQYWAIEKAARAAGERERAADRPIIGPTPARYKLASASLSLV